MLPSLTVFVCDVSVARSLLTPDDKFYVLNIPKVFVGYCRMERAKEKGENTLTLAPDCQVTFPSEQQCSQVDLKPMKSTTHKHLPTSTSVAIKC